jgi:micrococcal nuclease
MSRVSTTPAFERLYRIFSHIHDVKTSHRVIIEHINHNPPGKDTATKLDEEYVILENDGSETVSLAGWTLKDETTAGERRHVYAFPKTVSLSPREKAYVHTGPGADYFEKGTPSKWNLYWGRHSFVWNNEGDTATLFDADGNKVDSLQVVTLRAI